MSVDDWRTWLYTIPSRLSGIDTWKTRPWTITTSPIVIVPAATSWAARTRQVARPPEKMTDCPKLRSASEPAVLSAAWRYVDSEAS